MEAPVQKIQEEQWKIFKEYPFSQRTLNAFVNAEIRSVDRLTKTTSQELGKYRGVGRSVMMEIRLALARMNLSLEDEPIYKLLDASESDDLKTRLKALEQKRDEILVEIQHLKSQIMTHRSLKRKPVK